jgi:hypothetical protein
MLNGIQKLVATEDLGWDLDKAELIFDWASMKGYWPDWSEWDSEEFIEFFAMVEQEYYRAFPESPLAARYRSEKERALASHPTSQKRSV